MIFVLPPLLMVTFFPLVGCLIILFLSEKQKNAIRWTALVTSVLDFALAIWVLIGFTPSNADVQMVIDQPWMRIAGAPVTFHMGVDGLSILLLLLTTFLTPIALLSTWSAIKEQVKGFMLFFLLLEVGMVGVFLSLDLVLFYIFWEFTLVPMYFLIGIWGGERRIYAALKFFIYTMAGSVLMLVAILYVGITGGSFALPTLIGGPHLPANLQVWLFLAFGLAFAIKVPMWPLHSWLPDAHVEAPTAGSVILAGVLLKMGAYGFLRIDIPLFPAAARALAPWMAGLAVIGIIYGAMVAYVQKDLKKLVAYSSVSHLGFVILGLFALNLQGLGGGIIQMVNHGLSTGALFLFVGMIYERRHTRELDAFGGLGKVMVVLMVLTLIITLSSMGLPGLNGFVGEFSILVGAFNSTILASPWFAGVATLGVILAAIYLLTMFQKVFYGPLTKPENQLLKDLSPREIATLAPLLIMIFWIGVYPKPFFDLITPAVNKLLVVFK